MKVCAAVAMTICQFFLQGRCRFGDRCWNEHPCAGGAGGRQQQQSSGSNRHGWNTTNKSYSSVIQPSSFSKSAPWGGSRDQEKSSFSSFNSGASRNGNRGFALSQKAFSSPSSDGQKDEKKLLEEIVKDMEVWKLSGQWMFSVYSPTKRKPNMSGFTDISPEELRLEYHNFLTSNNLQSYQNSIQQLTNQWRNRVNELKNPNTSTKIVSLSHAKDGVNQTAPTFGFGSRQAVTFGSPGFPVSNSSSDKAQKFSFKPSSGFTTAPSVFGNIPAFGAAPSASSAVTASTPTFGFGKPEITSAASFSFKSPAASGFGPPGLSGFPTSMASGPVGAPAAPAFGSSSSATGFGSPGSHSHTAFSKSPNDTCGNSISTSLPVSNGSTTTDNVLFTPKDQLTPKELSQFQSKKFTLGKIPLKPPPMELLSI